MNKLRCTGRYIFSTINFIYICVACCSSPKKEHVIINFAECISLKLANWHDNITYIGEKAFFSCESLSAPTYNSSIINEYRDRPLVFPKNLETMGNQAFQFCKNITFIKLDETKLKVIPWRAFSDCYSLRYIHFPIPVEHIRAWAFANANATVIDLPKNLIRIASDAFSEVPLIHVECHTLLAPELGEDVFSSYTKEKGTLFIDRYSRDSYEDQGWYNFFKDYTFLN